MYHHTGDQPSSVYHFKRALKCGAKFQDIKGPYVKAVHLLLQNETTSADRQFDWAEVMDVYGDKKQAADHYIVAGKLFLQAFNPVDAHICAEKGMRPSPFVSFPFFMIM